MRSLTICLVLLISATAAIAEEKRLLDISELDDGTTYLLKRDGSSVTLEKVQIIKPDVPIDPDPDLGRVKKFQNVATVLIEQTDEVEVAKNLMALYQGMAQKSRPPKPLYTTPQQLEENIKTATDIFLIQSEKKELWQNFRELLTQEWVKIAQEGGNMEDYALLLDDASQGLAIATNSQNAEFDITKIFKILEILGDQDKTLFQKIILILPLILELFV
jgi:hypothetical protein